LLLAAGRLEKLSVLGRWRRWAMRSQLSKAYKNDMKKPADAAIWRAWAKA
jgi:hypothetical protein